MIKQLLRAIIYFLMTIGAKHTQERSPLDEKDMKIIMYNNQFKDIRPLLGQFILSDCSIKKTILKNLIVPLKDISVSADLRSKEELLSCITLSPDKSKCAMGYSSEITFLDDYEIKAPAIVIIDVKTNQPITTLNTGTIIHDIAWKPDGTQLLALDEQGLAYLWDIETKESKLVRNNICAIAWGKFIAFADTERFINMIDSSDHQIINRFFIGTEKIYPLAWSTKNNLAFIDRKWGSLHIWDTDQNILKTAPDYENHSFAWSPDGNTLATCGFENNRILIRDLDGIPLYEIEDSKYSHFFINIPPDVAIVWNSAGNKIATISEKFNVKIWDLAAKQCSYKGNLGYSQVTSSIPLKVAWSNDDTQLFTLFHNGKANITDIGILETIKTYLDHKLNYHQALFLLSLDKICKQRKSYYLDNSTEKVFNSLHPKVQESLQGLVKKNNFMLPCTII